jgi:hypothetical protein
MNRTLALVAMSGVLLAGCTTAVSGNGSFDGNQTAPTGWPSDASQGGGRQSLACGGGTVVSPDGAPYCYVLPTGVRQLKDVVLPGGGEFTTAVGFGGRDVIAVTMFRTPANTDDLDNDALQKATDQVVQQQLGTDFTFASSTGERVVVDGARTLHYHGTSKKDPFEIDFYFVYRGRAKLQVNCQFNAHRTEITTACQKLLQTLQFTTVE